MKASPVKIAPVLSALVVTPTVGGIVVLLASVAVAAATLGACYGFSGLTVLRPKGRLKLRQGTSTRS